MTNNTVLTFQKKRENPISPYLFGQNLEHTRSAVMGGLSAQMLRNRKFAGKPQKNLGLSKGWFPIGESVFFNQNGGDWRNGAIYTRHVSSQSMGRRNEIQSQSITNLSEGSAAGMGQDNLYFSGGAAYEFRIVTKTAVPLDLTVSVTDATGENVLDACTIPLIPGEWQTTERTLTPPVTVEKGCLRITYSVRARITVGAVSLMKAGHFHGMRSDVIADFKAISPRIIRWPGGNFAGEYRWRDGLLPADQRGPLQAFMEEETQPFSYGFDSHELCTDDFIALCREVGAEPFITINLTWDTPEDAADWVEYCNGDETTPMGKLRAERGHREPYHVHFWSLGNEMGYGHMEGPKTAESYTLTAREHAAAMKRTDPSVSLFASGPYPDPTWIEQSANQLKDIIDYVSLHCYVSCDLDYTSPEASEHTAETAIDQYRGCRDILRRMREKLDPSLKISFDEWNFWYAWYRPTSVTEGLFAAYTLHMLMTEAESVNAPVCSYFQAINECLIIVTPKDSTLTAAGQVFSLLSAHLGGCIMETNDPGKDPDTVMTCHEGEYVLTVINRSMKEPESYSFTLPDVRETDAVLLSADSILPGSRFAESELPVAQEQDCFRVTLPAHSLARLRFRRNRI